LVPASAVVLLSETSRGLRHVRTFIAALLFPATPAHRCSHCRSAILRRPESRVSVWSAVDDRQWSDVSADIPKPRARSRPAAQRPPFFDVSLAQLLLL